MEINLYNQQEVSLSQFKDEFDLHLIDLNRIARNLSYDISFSTAISKSKTDFSVASEFLNNTEFILKRLEEEIREINYIKSIHLFNTDGNTVYSAGGKGNVTINPHNRNWFQSILKEKELALLVKNNNLYYSQNDIEDIILFVSFVKITCLDEKLITNGVLIFALDSDFIYHLTERHYKSIDKLFLFDVNGKLIYASNKEIVYKTLPGKLAAKLQTEKQGRYNNKESDGVTSLISFATSRFNTIKILSYSSNSKIRSDIRLLTRYTVLFLFFLVSLFVLFIILFSRSISYPINKLENVMTDLEKTNFDKLSIIPEEYDTGLLSPYFNHLMQILNTMIIRINEHHKKEKEQELLILQSQINPHFVNNTLNTIRMMALIKGENEMALAIRKLIHLLQYSMRLGTIFISIKDEISQIKDYISLQQLRYDNKFKVSYNIENTVCKYKTLKFVLQPIVENSVFHGINNMSEDAEISINVMIIDDRIVYEISDNGVGIEENRLKLLLEKTRNENEEKKVGLLNVHSRLVQYFDQDSGLQISSEKGYGTKVKYSIPTILFEESETIEHSDS